MSLKIATVQLPAREYGLAKIKEYMTLADTQRADIVCFPEGFLNGYTRDVAEAEERAIPLSSSDFEAVLDELKDFQAAAIIGLVEQEGEALFNTAVVIKNGHLLGRYRKTHPQEGIFEAGTEYPVFALGGRKFGINICYDANFPEATQKLADQGAEIVFYPLNNELKKESVEKWRHKHIENLIERAKDAGIIAVSSDVIIRTATTTGYGCTAIVNERGELVVRVEELKEGILVTEM